MVSQKLVLLLCLVNLFLISQLFLLGPLIANPPLKFLKEFVNFFGCDLWLVYHERSLLAKCSQSRNNLLMLCMLRFFVIQAQGSPILSLLCLTDGHVEMCGGLTSPRYDIIDVDLDRLGVLAGHSTRLIFRFRTYSSLFLLHIVYFSTRKKQVIVFISLS